MDSKSIVRVWGVLFFAMFVVGIDPVWALELRERLSISGYGNAHLLGYSGRPQGGRPQFIDKGGLNHRFFQLPEFSLFFDFIVINNILSSWEMEAEDSENKLNFKQYLMSPSLTAWHLAPIIPGPTVPGPTVPGPTNVVGPGWSAIEGMAQRNQELWELGLLDLKFALINGWGSDFSVLDDNKVQLDTGMMQSTIWPREGFVRNKHNDMRDNNKAAVLETTFVSSDFPFDIGFLWYRGAPDTYKDLHLYGVQLNWLAQNWALKGEWRLADVKQNAGIDLVRNPMAALINASSGDYNLEAWSVEGSFVPLRWGIDKNRFLRLILRYDDIDTNAEVAFTPFDKWRITIGLEWQWAFNARLRYEFQHAEIDDFDKAPVPFLNAGGKEYIRMHMLSLVFRF